MGCSYRAQTRMPRWLLEQELAQLAAAAHPPAPAPDPDDIVEAVDLPWVA